MFCLILISSLTILLLLWLYFGLLLFLFNFHLFFIDIQSFLAWVAILYSCFISLNLISSRCKWNMNTFLLYYWFSWWCLEFMYICSAHYNFVLLYFIHSLDRLTNINKTSSLHLFTKLLQFSEEKYCSCYCY